MDAILKKWLSKSGENIMKIVTRYFLKSVMINVKNGNELFL